MTEVQLNTIRLLKTAKPSAFILLADDVRLQKALITWEPAFCIMEEAAEFNTLRECWDFARINFREWSFKSGLSIHELRRCCNVLKLNDLIYPDGTAHPNALLYVHSLASIKIKEVEKRTFALRQDAEERRRGEEAERGGEINLN